MIILLILLLIFFAIIGLRSQRARQHRELLSAVNPEKLREIDNKARAEFRARLIVLGGAALLFVILVLISGNHPNSTELPSGKSSPSETPVMKVYPGSEPSVSVTPAATPADEPVKMKIYPPGYKAPNSAPKEPAYSFSNVIPYPKLPLNYDDPAVVAQTRDWMIQKFGMPSDARISKFYIESDSACLIWDTFHEGEKTGHWSHTRSYKFSTQSVLNWVDVDLGKLGF